MNKKINIITTVIFAVVIAAASLCCYFKPDTVYSNSERRELAQKPVITAATIASGEFMQNFENYTTDQFPMREYFRRVKAIFSTKILAKLENNGLYTYKGHISKTEYPENPEMMDYAIKKFDNIYNKFLKNSDTKIYFSIVPDKNYFLAPEKGCLSIDYPSFIERFKTGLSYMNYIDIIPLLSEDDYYLTDSHWKQENIRDVALFLAQGMGVDVSAEYEEITVNSDFKGVYAGQSALDVDGEELKYLTNDTLKNAVVNYYDTGMPKKGDLYNMEKAMGKDPYEMFLSGIAPLVTIENENAKTDRELIIFRDSFGSSLSPLFSEGYKKVTVVDIRYVNSDFLGNFIDFGGQDVLFIYSTTLLNNSTALK